MIPVNAAQHILVVIVRVYQLTLSPAKTYVFGESGGCRYDPSCSAYALGAVKVHGALAGSWMALKRIGRCHPWGGCGEDPVPPKSAKESPAKMARSHCDCGC